MEEQGYKENIQEREKYGKRASIFCIICNVILCLAKGTVGFIAGALSIIADAANNLSDASSNIISFIGFKLASKPADKDHPYGHGRYEYLAGFIVSLLILVVGVELMRSGVEKIITPTEAEFSIAVIIVLSLSIIVKCLMMIVCYRIGAKIGAKTISAIGADSRNDMIATTAVLIALIISELSGVNLDGYMAIAVSLFIFISGIKIVKDTLNPLLGQAPSKELVEHIKNKIANYKEVLGIHDLIVHDYGPGRMFASVHAEMSDKMDPLISHEIIDSIERDFAENDGLMVVIHYDPVSCDDAIVNEIREFLSELVKTINEEMSVHDVRIVKGKENSNLIFDCVLPRDISKTEKEIRAIICDAVREKYPGFTCVITFDISFLL